jgi:hypothetical protein
MDSKRYFDIDYEQYAALLAPVILRKPMMIAFLAALVKPVGELHALFLSYAGGISAKNNAQVCYMQGLLNDEFDYYQRRIRVRTIDAGFHVKMLWKGAESNGRDVIMLSPDGTDSFLLLSEERASADGIDFEVVLPEMFYLSKKEEERMRAIVNENKIASKRFIITQS